MGDQLISTRLMSDGHVGKTTHLGVKLAIMESASTPTKQ
jgi:hypothetical protein